MKRLIVTGILALLLAAPVVARAQDAAPVAPAASDSGSVSTGTDQGTAAKNKTKVRRKKGKAAKQHKQKTRRKGKKVKKAAEDTSAETQK